MKKNLRNSRMEMRMQADEAASLPIVDFTYSEIVKAKGRLSCTSCISAAVECVKALNEDPFNREALADLFVLQCGTCYDNEQFMMPRTADVMDKVRSFKGTEMQYGLIIEVWPDPDDDKVVYMRIDDVRTFDGSVAITVEEYDWEAREYKKVDSRTEVDGNLWYAWGYYSDPVDDYALYRVGQCGWLTIS